MMDADSETRLTPLRDSPAWLRGRPEPTADFSALDAWQAVKGRRWAKETEDVSDASRRHVVRSLAVQGHQVGVGARRLEVRHGGGRVGPSALFTARSVGV